MARWEVVVPSPHGRPHARDLCGKGKSWWGWIGWRAARSLHLVSRCFGPLRAVVLILDASRLIVTGGDTQVG